MNEIIKINNDNKVSGRELHEFLEVGRDFTTWMKKMIGYGFNEHADFEVYTQSGENPTGGRPSVDYIMSIEMAKEICMIQRTEKGKQARQYFIECERRLKGQEQPVTLEQQMAQGLLAAQKLLDAAKLELAQSKQIINELQPKASYYDLILQSKSLLSVSKIAKDYGKSAIWLNRKLEEKKVQYCQGGIWLLYQKYAEKGYTQSTSHVIDDEHSRLLTKWTQKGRLFIYELLKGDGILPLIEQQG